MPLFDRRLTVTDAKLVDYLLNLAHLDGGPKARFFVARGFQRDNPSALAEALFNHARDNWPGRRLSVGAESKFIIEGPFRSLDGTAPNVRSVWQGPAIGAEARLITAYPIQNSL